VSLHHCECSRFKIKDFKSPLSPPHTHDSPTTWEEQRLNPEKHQDVHFLLVSCKLLWSPLQTLGVVFSPASAVTTISAAMPMPFSTPTGRMLPVVPSITGDRRRGAVGDMSQRSPVLTLDGSLTRSFHVPGDSFNSSLSQAVSQHPESFSGTWF
jgi:hypothetical protein